MAKTKKPTKKKKEVEPMTPAFTYLIEDIDAAMSTVDINFHCNDLGSQGWKLVYVGTTVRTAAEQEHPSQVRLWWMQ